jgi:hypothetical protein
MNRDGRPWLLALLAVAVVSTVFVMPPLPAPAHYGIFADRRVVLGIPNFFDVVSNLPFLLIGAWGLHVVASDPGRAFSQPLERWPYALVFLSVALSGVGSAYYHFAPDDGRLMWDRLPIALGFMALVSAVATDRLSVKAGLYALAPLLVAGAASVVHWRLSLLRGAEDIVPYAVVQFGAIAAVLIIAALYRPRYTCGGYLYAAVATYGLAKVAEVLDAQIYAVGGIVSGHTLKHLFAALAVWWLLRMLRLRAAF